jgi:hypothetical protein
MNEVQTITDIRTIKNAIKEGIKKGTHSAKACPGIIAV